jgi:4-nitrophenyl phosphatase
MGLGKLAAKGIVVVGDDPGLEMRMANAAGAISIGMTTGLMKQDSIAKLAVAERPTLLLDSLGPLLSALQGQ